VLVAGEPFPFVREGANVHLDEQKPEVHRAWLASRTRLAIKTGWQFRTGWQIISQPTPATPVPVTAQHFGTQKRVASLTRREGSGASWPRYRYSWGCYQQKDKRAVHFLGNVAQILGLNTPRFAI
jgi:hypothetical protein